MTQFNLDYYLSKIPPLHAGKPKFVAMVSAAVAPLADAIALLESLPQAFDIDSAVGVQLDIVGKWVGRTRSVPIPLQNIFFSFGDPLRGWGRGIWHDHDVNPGVTYTNLDDNTYRRLLKAVALANEWDGTVAGAQPVLDQYFVPGEGTYTFMQDDARGVQSAISLPVSLTIGISGIVPNIVDLQILSQNLLGLKPGGIDVKYAVTSVSGAPLFGFGVNNEYIGGWGRGAWATTPEEIAAADPALLQP